MKSLEPLELTIFGDNLIEEKIITQEFLQQLFPLVTRTKIIEINSLHCMQLWRGNVCNQPTFCMSNDSYSNSCQLALRKEYTHEGDTTSQCVWPVIGWHQFDMSYYWHIWGTGSSHVALPRSSQKIIVNRSESQTGDMAGYSTRWVYLFTMHMGVRSYSVRITSDKF